MVLLIVPLAWPFAWPRSGFFCCRLGRLGAIKPSILSARDCHISAVKTHSSQKCRECVRYMAGIYCSREYRAYAHSAHARRNELKSPTHQLGESKEQRNWVNTSKPYLPVVDPFPLGPIPPKGTVVKLLGLVVKFKVVKSHIHPLRKETIKALINMGRFEEDLLPTWITHSFAMAAPLWVLSKTIWMSRLPYQDR